MTQQPDDDDELERDRGADQPDNDEGEEVPAPPTDRVADQVPNDQPVDGEGN